MRMLVALVVAGAVSAAAMPGGAAARPAEPAAVPPPPCVALATPAIAVDNGSYTPAHQTLGAAHGLGGKQTWFWLSGASASVTYTGKLKLFDSGIRSSGATFSHTFRSAGTYRFHSTNDATQKGSIVVPLCNVPRSARVGHPVWVQTSNRSLTTHAEDVQVRRPGSTHWKWLKTGFRGIEFSWKPGSAGTYRLRARLRDRSTNAVSRFSPISTVKVS